jgi:hypothetical protein
MLGRFPAKCCAGATSSRESRRYKWARDGAPKRNEGGPSSEPRAGRLSAVFVPGCIRDWDCARGSGPDRLNVFGQPAPPLPASASHPTRRGCSINTLTDIAIARGRLAGPTSLSATSLLRISYRRLCSCRPCGPQLRRSLVWVLVMALDCQLPSCRARVEEASRSAPNGESGRR